MDKFVMTDEMREALRYLDIQLESGYVDISDILDRNEFIIVERAIKEFKQKYCKRETINHEQN